MVGTGTEDTSTPQPSRLGGLGGALHALSLNGHIAVGEALVEQGDDRDQQTPHIQAQRQARVGFIQRVDVMSRDVGDAAGLLTKLEVGRRVPDGDIPCALWQLRLLETDAATDGYRSGREQLDDVDRFDTEWPRFEVARTSQTRCCLASISMDSSKRISDGRLSRLLTNASWGRLASQDQSFSRIRIRRSWAR